MSLRIEVAELLSFRLKLPKRALEQALEFGPDTPLSLSREDGELVLCDREADSFLRFRPIGEEAILTDAALLNDPHGRFFRVLGKLVMGHGGDLEAQLVWSDDARNADDAWTQVRIARGLTSHPALSVQKAQRGLQDLPEAFGDARDGAARGPRNQMRAAGGAGADGLGAAGNEASHDAEAEELARLLLRAEQAWAEYQRLKANRDTKR